MRQLLSELRRRGTLRTAAVYAAVAWLITEVSATVFPALYLPDWSITAVVILFILGFPVTMVLSWVFDIGPSGIERAAPMTAGRKLTVVFAGVLLVAATALLVVIIYPDAGEQSTGKQPASAGYTPLENSVAVLPFTDMSSKKDHEYLADGLADTLLHRLAQVSELTVIARTSSFVFKDRQDDIRDIGRRLNVGAVLEGSVQRVDDTVRITAQLIDAETGAHLWSGVFDRPAQDIFAIQDEISEAVTKELVGELLDRESVVPSRGQTTNVDAYDLYLLGRHYWHRRTPESLAQSIRYFEQAIRVDPDYALAHIGLADAYEGLSWYANQPWRVYLERAEPLLGRALLLDEELPEVHASLGNYYRVKGEFQKSEAAYQRAITLNPNSAVVHMWYAMTLRGTGRYDESLDAARQAMTLDPLSFKASDHVAFGLYLLGEFDAAVAQYHRSIELAPDHPDAYRRIGEIRAATGRLDEAVAWLMEAVARDPQRVGFAWALALLYLDLGDNEQAGFWLERAIESVHDPAQILDLRSAILIADDRLADNVELARGQLEAAPGDPWTLRRLGYAELLHEDPAAAGLHFEAAGVQAPGVGSMIYDAETAWHAFRDPLSLANVYMQTGENERAAELLERSRTCLEWLRREGFALPVADYIAASLHALAGEQETALASLQRAADRGWRRHWMATRDPNLASVRDTDRFREIIAHLRSETGRMRERVRQARNDGDWESLRQTSTTAVPVEAH